MKFTADILLATLFAISAAAAPLNPIVEMRPRDLDLTAPEPEGYIKRSAPLVDRYATRSSWKREPDAEVEAPEPEGYIKRSAPLVDRYATRSEWKRNPDAKTEAEA